MSLSCTSGPATHGLGHVQHGPIDQEREGRSQGLGVSNNLSEAWSRYGQDLMGHREPACVCSAIVAKGDMMCNTQLFRR